MNAQEDLPASTAAAIVDNTNRDHAAR